MICVEYYTEQREGKQHVNVVKLSGNHCFDYRKQSMNARTFLKNEVTNLLTLEVDGTHKFSIAIRRMAACFSINANGNTVYSQSMRLTENSLSFYSHNKTKVIEFVWEYEKMLDVYNALQLTIERINNAISPSSREVH